LTHGLQAHNVRAAAIALADAAPYLPSGAVVLAVVDPSVGGSRMAIAADTADGVSLVGPDNGLLWLAAERLGGVTALAEISNSVARLQPVSDTFHGRDIFAPVAARIALGDTLEKLGNLLAPDSITPLDLPVPQLSANALQTEVLDIDHFGNIRLCASAEALQSTPVELRTAVEVEASGLRMPALRVATYSDVSSGELLLYEDSSGALAIAVNGGSAAQLLGADRSSTIKLIWV
ncbi:MAG: SAM-dependent chlorinase/fluorinase, partial [Thermoleophilaceae bacterium]|nr:SAM-dependent chlorinase/fluorinase [Thermoleophilaceae bacterium]